jgi:RNA polymerase sigma factor (sigma-70 family)
MQLRHSTPTETLSYISHPSFQEDGAADVYGAAPVDDHGEASRSYMHDEVTRDCARRMHYAGYRAAHADRRHTADVWGRRYYALRERIILGNRKLIYRAVSRFQTCSMADDLIGECHIVMIRAVTSYNPWLGIRFSTYACTCLFRALGRLGRRLLAERSRTALDLDTVAQPSSFHEDTYESPSGWPVVQRHLCDNDSLLTLREKRILEQRFGLTGAHGSPTLVQIGADLGISKERVRQLQTSALGKLRQVLMASAPSS